VNFALSQHAPYYRAIRSAFAVLHSATEHVREKSVMRQVTISLIPLFGINLFIPRLVEFLAQNRNWTSTSPTQTTAAIPANQPLARQSQRAADLGCRLALLQPRIPSAPRAPIDSPQALSQLPLLHDEERGTWAEWFQVAEVKHASALNGLLLEDGYAGADRPGLLAARAVGGADVASGELVKLFDLHVDDGRQYYLCRRSNSELSDENLSSSAAYDGYASNR
jgi:hypothetical protein